MNVRALTFTQSMVTVKNSKSRRACKNRPGAPMCNAFNCRRAQLAYGGGRRPGFEASRLLAVETIAGESMQQGKV